MKIDAGADFVNVRETMEEGCERGKKISTNLIKMQTELALISQLVQASLEGIGSDKAEMRASELKYYEFLQEVSQRSQQLNQYTESLLNNEREFTQEKQNYEKLLAKRIRELRKDETQLKGSLADARQQLILLCNKKSQIGKVLASVSQTIAEFSSQERNLDHLCQKAETITKQAKLFQNKDQNSVDTSESSHIMKMKELVDQQLKSAHARIEHLTQQKATLNEDKKKATRRIDVLHRLLDLKQDIGGQNNDLSSLEQDQVTTKAEIEAKKKMLEQIKSEKDRIEKEVAKHKSIECSIFIDSKRSFDHSKLIGETAKLVRLQSEECIEMLKIAKAELDSKLFHEENLQNELQRLKSEIGVCDSDEGNLRSQLANATHETEMISAIEADLADTMAIANEELSSVMKAKRQAAIEEEAMKIAVARDSFSEYDDTRIQLARREVTKRVKLIECEIETVRRDIEDLQVQLQKRSVIGLKSQEALMNSDKIKMKALVKECRELFGSDFSDEAVSEIEDKLRSQSFSRGIRQSNLQSQISMLAESINRMRSAIETKRDSVSMKRASYSSSVLVGYSQITAFTPTFKRSQRFPQIQNTLEDRIHVLSLVCQTLENLLGHITSQLDLWRKAMPQLEDWSKILDRMQDKADDLVVWKQLFCHSGTEASLF